MLLTINIIEIVDKVNISDLMSFNLVFLLKKRADATDSLLLSM